MKSIEQHFFNDLEKKLWTAANKLLPALDAAVYKHVVLGLIFLKYVSDTFEEHQCTLRAAFADPAHDYYLDPADYGSSDTTEYAASLATELEDRNYYTASNVFWVPLEARWQTLRDCAQLPPKAPLPWPKPGKSEPEEMRSVGWLIDHAMEAVERENPRLKNVLNKDFARTQIDSAKLAELIALFSDTDFSAKPYQGQPLSLQSKDILGHVYEYFLGQFALAEGKKAANTTRPKASSPWLWTYSSPSKAVSTIPRWDPAASSCKARTSSSSTAAHAAKSAFTGKRVTPRLGDWPR